MLLDTLNCDFVKQLFTRANDIAGHLWKAGVDETVHQHYVASRKKECLGTGEHQVVWYRPRHKLVDTALDGSNDKMVVNLQRCNSTVPAVDGKPLLKAAHHS